MKKIIPLAVLATALALTACGDKTADTIKEKADDAKEAVAAKAETRPKRPPRRKSKRLKRQQRKKRPAAAAALDKMADQAKDATQDATDATKKAADKAVDKVQDAAMHRRGAGSRSGGGDEAHAITRQSNLEKSKKSASASEEAGAFFQPEGVLSRNETANQVIPLNRGSATLDFLLLGSVRYHARAHYRAKCAANRRSSSAFKSETAQ